MKKYTKRLWWVITLIFFTLLPFSMLQSCSDDDVEEKATEEVDDSDFVTNTRDTTFSNAVVIKYSANTATVVNPYEGSGVAVTISDGDVVVTSTIDNTDVNYVLSGITSNGSLKVNSDYKFNLIFNGVSIRNDNGSAIHILSSKKASVQALKGTNNRLIDGAKYATSNADQKGTFFSEGQLVFIGTGALSVTGNYKHGICSDDYISVEQGSIEVAAAASDAIHANDYIKMSGGTLSVKSSGDGIDCEEGYIEISGGKITVTSADDGIVASYDGTDASIVPYILLTGAAIDVTVTGDKASAVKSNGTVTINTNEAITLAATGKAGKGIKAKDIVLSEGNLAITTSGSAFYDTADKDVAAPSGIACDGNFKMENGTLAITSTGSGGRGLHTDGTFSIDNGNLKIVASGANYTYSGNTTEAKGIKSVGALTINGGNIAIAATDDGMKSSASVTINGGSIAISKSTEGIEAPFITFNNGSVSVVSTDDAVNGSHGNGGESDDGSVITFAGGTLAFNTSGGDGVDCNGSIVMTGGTVISQGPSSAPELALDYNGTFKISNGLFIGSGPNSGGMIQASSSSSAQYAVLMKISGNVLANTVFNIQDAAGNSLVTYTPARNAYYFVFSSSALQSGASYKVYTGGAVSGGTTTNGLNTGGTYSGGTQKTTFTISSKVTTITL